MERIPRGGHRAELSRELCHRSAFLVPGIMPNWHCFPRN